MSKELSPLEALEDIRELFTSHDFDLLEKCSVIEKALKAYEELEEQLPIINKYIRALEVIKSIGILKPYETSGGQCWLETMCDATKITKENYDLLKEVLL